MQVGETVRDDMGETWCVMEVTPYGYLFLEPWFTGKGAALISPKFLVPYTYPAQPEFGGCPHPRKTFIGLGSGRFACAICGEWL